MIVATMKELAVVMAPTNLFHCKQHFPNFLKKKKNSLTKMLSSFVFCRTENIRRFFGWERLKIHFFLKFEISILVGIHFAVVALVIQKPERSGY